jgi:hypothetical protein
LFTRKLEVFFFPAVTSAEFVVSLAMSSSILAGAPPVSDDTSARTAERAILFLPSLRRLSEPGGDRRDEVTRVTPPPWSASAVGIAAAMQRLWAVNAPWFFL